jgi:hypothetical protein
MADPILLGLTAGELASLGMGGLNFLSGMNQTEQAPQQPVSPGNPQAAMQFMPQIPMATYNPMMMDQALIEEQMLMQQAPPRGLLY